MGLPVRHPASGGVVTRKSEDTMNFIPIDVMNTQPQAGGMGLPDGFYILQMVDASEVRPERNGQFIRRIYKTKVLMGPGASQEMAGRPYSDPIRENDPGWAGRHMELFVACLGSIENVRQIAQQNGGGIPPAVLVGRTYIAQVVKGEQYSNVLQRLPYTQENWAASIGGGNGSQTQQAAAPVSGGMLAQSVAQPGMPPAQQYAPAPQMAAPVQQYAAPPQGMPGMPMQMPGVPTAPQANAVPTPPPPPGFPATGK